MPWYLTHCRNQKFASEYIRNKGGDTCLCNACVDSTLWGGGNAIKKIYSSIALYGLKWGYLCPWLNEIEYANDLIQHHLQHRAWNQKRVACLDEKYLPSLCPGNRVVCWGKNVSIVKWSRKPGIHVLSSIFCSFFGYGKHLSGKLCA